MAERQAQKKFPQVDFSLMTIATPADIDAQPTSDQELMFVKPEPGSLILLASGVLGSPECYSRS